MPQSKVKRKVGPKDTVRRAYEYDREQAEIAREREGRSKRPQEGPTTSPIHLLPDGGLLGDTKKKIKEKKRREADY